VLRTKSRKLGWIAAAVVAMGVVTAAPAGATDYYVFCDGDRCTTDTIAAGPNHQVCIGGKSYSLFDWGNVELWDLDTAVRVGYQAVNQYRYQQKCIGGLYGKNYYGVAHGKDVHVEVHVQY